MLSLASLSRDRKNTVLLVNDLLISHILESFNKPEHSEGEEDSYEKVTDAFQYQRGSLAMVELKTCKYPSKP